MKHDGEKAKKRNSGMANSIGNTTINRRRRGSSEHQRMAAARHGGDGEW